MGPVVALYGIGGTYNYGCEAIVRGTAAVLREVWPELRLRYVSPTPGYDRRALADLDIEVVPRTGHAKWSLPRLCAALLRRCGSPLSRQPYHEDVRWLDHCDMVFSIGGDMYTLSMAYHLAHLGEIAKRKGKKFVIWGASIGPLPPGDPGPLLRHFETADLITAREPEAVRFLHERGIFRNVVEVADPAFAVRAQGAALRPGNDRLRIAVNLSPVAAGGGLAGAGAQRDAAFVSGLVERLGAEVILVPHVVSGQCLEDDDLRYLLSVRERVASAVAGDVAVAQNEGGFRGAKEILRSCDAVVASRMHCAINAASEGIPVLLVAYSQKAYGMCEYLYGSRRWVVSAGELAGEGLRAVTSLVEQAATVREHLERRVERARAGVFAARDRLLELGH